MDDDDFALNLAPEVPIAADAALSAFANLANGTAPAAVSGHKRKRPTSVPPERPAAVSSAAATSIDSRRGGATAAAAPARSSGRAAATTTPAGSGSFAPRGSGGATTKARVSAVFSASAAAAAAAAVPHPRRPPPPTGPPSDRADDVDDDDAAGGAPPRGSSYARGGVGASNGSDDDSDSDDSLFRGRTSSRGGATAAVGGAGTGGADAAAGKPSKKPWDKSAAAAASRAPAASSSFASAIADIPTGTGGTLVAPSAEELLASHGVRMQESAAAAAAVTFDSLGVDPRLVDKLTAPAASASGGPPAAMTAPGASHAGGVSATTGILRGHLRDGFGLSRPTRVQRIVLPIALSDKDRRSSMCVRSETGSGKTLAFLLPVVQDLLALGDASTGALARDAGTLALILAPTRELCGQIFAVATRLLQPFPHIVPGLITGGEKRKSEKARLRKGIHVLVATPGRLLDHLRTTTAFKTAGLRHVVMDEADRLLDMGFGAQVQAVVNTLRGKTTTGTGHTWRTVLLSATLSASVRTLAASLLSPGERMMLLDASLRPLPIDLNAADDADASAGASGGPIMKKTTTTTSSGSGTAAGDDGGGAAEEDEADGEEGAAAAGAAAAGGGGGAGSSSSSSSSSALHFSAPTTLHQVYYVVPLKWRLVTLLATLYEAAKRVARAKDRDRAKDGTGKDGTGSGAKMILFVSTTAAVDFHYALLTWLLPRMMGGATGSFPVHRLHGNIAQAQRTETYRAFAGAPRGLLIATDVASRGLDLPAVDVIVQADAPSDTSEYVHRIGRTARRGERGEAILLLQPHEAPYAEVLAAAGLRLTPFDTAPVLAALVNARQPTGALFEMPVLLQHPQHKGAGGAGGRRRGAGGDDDDHDDDDDAGGGRAGGDHDDDASGAVSEAMALLMPRGMRAVPLTTGGDGSKKPGVAGTGSGSSSGTGRIPSRISHLLEAARDTAAHPAQGKRAEMQAALWQGLCEELVLRLPLADALAPTATAAAVDAGAAASGGEEERSGATAAAAAGASVAGGSLLPLARDAFASFVRAYATHERAVRHIFHPRALHLGHAAKAFGLKETPSVAVQRGRHDAAEEDAKGEAAAGRGKGTGKGTGDDGKRKGKWAGAGAGDAGRGGRGGGSDASPAMARGRGDGSSSGGGDRDRDRGRGRDDRRGAAFSGRSPLRQGRGGGSGAGGARRDRSAGGGSRGPRGSGSAGGGASGRERAALHWELDAAGADKPAPPPLKKRKVVVNEYDA